MTSQWVMALFCVRDSPIVAQQWVTTLLGTSNVMSQWIMMLLCVHNMTSQWIMNLFCYITIPNYDIAVSLVNSLKLYT